MIKFEKDIFYCRRFGITFRIEGKYYFLTLYFNHCAYILSNKNY